MTQFEFDNEMKRLNEMQTQEYNEVDTLMLENHRQQDLVKAQIRSLRDVLDSYKTQAHDLHNRKKEIARKYHDMKHQHCIDNPKSSMTD